MARIRSKNTSAEIAVRRVIFAMGYRFRLHRRDLPGVPDIVLPRLGKIVLVHGCFWHMHRCKHLPKSNIDYWKPKLAENVRRDVLVRRRLRKLGWQVLVVWECWRRRPSFLASKIERFLSM